jgi:hypothetical protein
MRSAPDARRVRLAGAITFNRHLPLSINFGPLCVVDRPPVIDAPLLPAQRRERIVGLLRRSGAATLQQLPQALEVPPSTLRRDLDGLAAEKRAIGQPATAALQPHQSVILDNGTTVLEAAVLVVSTGTRDVSVRALASATARCLH